MRVTDQESPTTGESVPVEQRLIPCEVYSRVVGYMTPVGQWNDGKKQEWAERIVYEEVGV